mmetsp:Transcript_13936/g.35034  ORF Transcript_13936/g.35034 Transcript_13936/m.35034 type:complete len:100 (-) Transcript_13936:23-322(-)
MLRFFYGYCVCHQYQFSSHAGLKSQKAATTDDRDYGKNYHDSFASFVGPFLRPAPAPALIRFHCRRHLRCSLASTRDRYWVFYGFVDHMSAIWVTDDER